MSDEPTSHQMMMEIHNILDEVTDERSKQIGFHGYTYEHDDAHDECELARAAACYATGPENHLSVNGVAIWPADWFPAQKTTKETYRESLVKACALLVAEIQRIDRKRAKEAAASNKPAEA